MTTEPGDPLMIGDHPAADFLNSVGAPYGRWTDWLESGQALVAIVTARTEEALSLVRDVLVE